MKVVLGSKSQLKIDLTEMVFNQSLPDDVEVSGLGVSSGVSETPWGEETYRGALNRARDCRLEGDAADYFVGLESGLVERFGILFEEAWAVVIDSGGREFVGYSSGLPIPKVVVDMMSEKKLEHYQVMDILDNEFTASSKDTWHLYSGGKVSRALSLEESLRNALIQTIELDGSLYAENS